MSATARNAFLGAALVFAAAAAPPDLSDDATAALVTRVTPSVVSITIIPESGPPTADDESKKVAGPATRVKQPAEETNVRPTRMVGSGFIIDAGGLIVTNKHVVHDARRILVTLEDGTVLRGSVVAMAAAADVALVQIHARHPLPAVTFGDSAAVRAGEPVIAIGNPLGRGESVSAGIVSALNRDIRSSPFDDFIQTDAAINHGSSGGPLFNMKGEVIGMNTALDSPTEDGGSIGIGYSMPAGEVRFVADSLRQYGYVRAGWIGAAMQPVPNLVAEALGLPNTQGAIVARVMANTPAEKAGLRQGDVIRSFDGRDLSDVRQLMRRAGRVAPGTSVTLSVWRDGALLPVQVTLAQYPAESAKPASTRPPSINPQATPDFGLQLAAATPDLRKRHKLPSSASGPIVIGIESDGEAGDTSIATGDMIVKVQNATPRAPAEVIQALRAAQSSGAKAAVLLVLRGDVYRWIGIPLGDAR